MRSIFSSKSRKTAAAIALVAVTSLSAAACGSSDDTKPASSSAAPAPKPVASIDSLTGNTTQVTLDQGFVDALTALKLTPGTVGTAKLEDGALIFPITGGNVTVFKPGQVSPYVVGQIQHEGSGLSLAAGGTKVELTNLNVDPTVSRVYGDVTVNGKVAATSAYLFQLDGRTLKPLQDWQRDRHARGHQGGDLTGGRTRAEQGLQDRRGQGRSAGRHREDHRQHHPGRLIRTRTSPPSFGG